ncbi:MAG: hypothetical protein H6620_05780 [Halobacteriovoraceae bacterium]|nr:hypothetical protein [Halobacteriovoraceae bacterium]
MIFRIWVLAIGTFFLFNSCHDDASQSSPSVSRRPDPIVHDDQDNFHVVLLADGLKQDIDFGMIAPKKAIQDRILLVNSGTTKAYLVRHYVDHYTENFKIISHCLAILEPGEECEVFIRYQSETKQAVEDYLKFEFRGNDKNNKQVVGIKLLAQSSEKVTRSRERLEINPFDGAKSRFNPLPMGSEKSVLIQLENSGEYSTYLSNFEFLFKNPDFNFSGGKFPGTRGTCQYLFNPGTCFIEIEFKPSVFKSNIDNILKLTYSKRELHLNLRGSSTNNYSGKCSTEYEKIVLPKKFDETDEIVMPYDTQDLEKTLYLEFIYGLSSNNFDLETQIAYNQNSLVLLNFDFPNLGADGKNIDKIAFDLGLSTFKNKKEYDDDIDDLESLFCISQSQFKGCLGTKPSGELWEKLASTSFWKDAGAVANDNILTHLYRSPVKLLNPNKHYFQLKENLSLSDNFSQAVDALANLFENSTVGIILVNDLKFDEIPRLVMSFKKEIACENKVFAQK